MAKSKESFHKAAKRYETWLYGYCMLDLEGLEQKRKKMKDSAFAFLRATYFRWEHCFEAVGSNIRKAPNILCIGDIHLENYGTWRDEEGWLVWGVNDFDEATELPFTSDLVRLATSALLEGVRQEETNMASGFSGEAAIDAIAAGYAAGLEKAPMPFVLENDHPALRDLAIVTGEAAVGDWDRIRADGEVDANSLDAAVHDLLLTCLPPGTAKVRFYRRRSGLGSLGRRRYVAVGKWYGGLVAREAKAAAPSANCMPETGIAHPLADYRRIAALGYRARDPHLRLADRWIVRRLSPEARKIEIAEIEKLDDQRELLHAMGRELANIHRGTAGTAAQLTKFLAKLPKDWLHDAAAAAAERVIEDFDAFRQR